MSEQGNIGNATIGIFASTEQAIRAINALEARLRALVRPFGDVQQAGEKVKEEFRSIVTDINKFSAEIRDSGGNLKDLHDRIDELATGAQKQAQAVQKAGQVQSRAIQDNIRLNQKQAEAVQRVRQQEIKAGQQAILLRRKENEQLIRDIQRRVQIETQAAIKAEQARRLQSSGVPVIDKATASIQRYGLAQEKAAKANEIFNNRAAAMQGRFGFILRGFDAVNARLAKFGLNMRDVNIALGAGFLTTSGPAIALLAIVKGAQLALRALQNLAKFAVEVGRLAAEFEHLRKQVEFTFDSGSASILKFIDNADKFGATRAQLAREVVQIGNLFKGFGIDEQVAANFTEGLTQAASVLQRTSQSGDDLPRVLENIRSALGGSTEVLKEYGLRLNEIDLKNIAEQHGALFPEALTTEQKALITSIAVIEKAKQGLDDYAAASDNLAVREQVLREEFNELKTQIGALFAPVLEKAVILLTGFIRNVSDTIETFQRMARAVKGFADNVNAFVNRHQILIEALDQIKRTMQAAHPVANAIIKSLQLMGEAGEDVTPNIDKLDETLKELKATLLDEAQAALASGDAYARIIEAHEKLKRVKDEAAESELKARIDLQRAEQDALRSIADAERDLQRTIRDGEEDIADARDDLADAERDRLRAIRDAEEKLAEKRKDQNKKVADAEKALARQRKDQARAILQATLTLEEALADGDLRAINRAYLALTEARRKEEIVDAEQRLRDAEAERLDEIRKAERELAETREDEREKVLDAQEKLRRSIRETAEEIGDAQRKLSEVEIETNRRLYDAKTRLDEVLESNVENLKDAQKAQDELTEKFGVGVGKAKVLKELTEERNKLLKEANAILAEQRDIAGDIAERLVVANQAWADIATNSAFAAVIGGLGLSTEGRASGGPVMPGRAYTWNEGGRSELLITPSGGTVISNREFRRLVSAMEGGNRGDINVYEAADPDATAQAVAARLGRRVNN